LLGQTVLSKIAIHAKQSFQETAGPIAELGFIRIVAHPAYRRTVTAARDVFLDLKSAKTVNFTFLPDDLDASELPRWVSTAKQTTDGYLLQLAGANGIQVATLDERFPEGF
jgi:hypothetical protein